MRAETIFKLSLWVSALVVLLSRICHESSIVVEDRTGNRPPQYYIRFEDIGYAIKAYESLENDHTISFRVTYAKPPRPTNARSYDETNRRGRGSREGRRGEHGSS